MFQLLLLINVTNYSIYAIIPTENFSPHLGARELGKTLVVKASCLMGRPPRSRRVPEMYASDVPALTHAITSRASITSTFSMRCAEAAAAAPPAPPPAPADDDVDGAGEALFEKKLRIFFALNEFNCLPETL